MMNHENPWIFIMKVRKTVECIFYGVLFVCVDMLPYMYGLWDERLWNGNVLIKAEKIQISCQERSGKSEQYI